jgi:MFS family permease
MALGTVIASVALLLMSISESLDWLRFSFLLLSIANNMILAPYSALVPDVVPVEQRGTAAGWLGNKRDMYIYIRLEEENYTLIEEHQSC